MDTRKIFRFIVTLILLLAQFSILMIASVQADQVAPETGIAGPQTEPVVISDVGLESLHPAVAYNSIRDQYLAVWYNDRPSNDDIQAQRLDKNGKFLGGKFYIATGVNHERRFPDVAYDSKNDQYLVVWQDFNSAPMISGDAIYGRRVSGSGEVLDMTDIVIKGIGGNLFSPQKPKVEYGYKSNKFLVVWEDTAHPLTVKKDILGKIVLPNGTIEGETIIISDDTGNGDFRQAPDVVYNRDTNRFMVVFEQLYSSQYVWGISGQQITGDGALWQSNFIIEYSSNDATEPSVAALSTDPNAYTFIVTYKFDNGSDMDIVRIFIDDDNSLGNKALVTSFDYNENNPAIAANESSNNFLISWTQPNPEESPPYDNISIHKYASNGTPIGESIDIAGTKTDNSVVAAGELGDYLIVYDRLVYNGYDIFGILYRQVDWQIFQDVGSSHWAFSWINRLYAAGVTSGCSQAPRKYCPEQTVTRAEMAKFLLKGVHGPAYEPPPVAGSTGFNDVLPSYWAAAWIKQLSLEGITSGCGGGNYCPSNQVTRAEMAKFLLKAKHGAFYDPPAVGTTTGFDDVATGYWAAAWIKQLAAEGITSGCGGGNYCPDASVTRAEMAKFLINTFALP